MSFVRRMLGLIACAMWVVYIVAAYSARVEPTVAREVVKVVEFYQRVGATLFSLLYFFGAGAWMFGGMAHAGLLAVRGQPSRRTALVPLIGLVVMVVSSLLSVSSGGESSPYAGQKDPNAYILLAAIAVPFIVQILDLVLPPWKSAPKVVARLVPRSEW